MVEGFGIGLRRPYYEEILETTRRVDWLEITPENFMRFGGAPARALDAARERWQVVPHGVSLSIGGPDPLDREYLARVRALCKKLDSPWFSDHVCYSSIGGQEFHDLFPLPFSREAVAHVAKRCGEVERRVGRPFLLENPSYYALMPGGEMDEADFLCEILSASGAGLLLDVNNVWVNAQNHGYDPRAFIDRLPLERVGYVHLAGHTRYDDVIIDTHAAAAIDPVWDLYRYVVPKLPAGTPALYEWDQDIPSLDAALDQAERARAEAMRALSEARRVA
jgi:uncharacterized protein (UPF0276 family)